MSERTVNHLTTEGCYAILGLRAGATHREVQRAYRRLALRHHPDVAGDDPVARAEFTRITRAYRTIATLDRLREHLRRAGCCDRCGTADELFIGLDRRNYCAECLLESRRRLLPLPVVKTIRCLSVISIQAVGVVSAARYLATGQSPLAAVALSAAVVSLVLLGYLVFSADQVEA